MHDDHLEVIHNKRSRGERRKAEDRRVSQKPFEGEDRRIGDRRSGQDRRSDQDRREKAGQPRNS